MNQKSKEKKTIKQIIENLLKYLIKTITYIFSIFLIISGLLYLATSFLTGMIFLVAGLINLPYFFNKIREFLSTKLKLNFTRVFSIALVCTLSITAIISTAQTKIQDAQASKKKIERVKEVENNRINQEKEEENNRIATIINDNITFESELGQQPIEEVKKVNLTIAEFTSSTKSKEMFKVKDVIDGDTLKLEKIGNIRLIGIDTPEVKDPRKPIQCFGQEASSNLKNLINDKYVYLEFDSSNRIDKYGRTLAYVFGENDLDINLSQVREGYAFAYTKYPHPKMDKFREAERQSREAKKGLWSETTCNGEQKSVEFKTPIVTPIIIPQVIQNPQPKQILNPPIIITKPTVEPKAINPTISSGVVKKSRTNICHGVNTTYYEKTTNFTPYTTLQECLNSGGRLPKR